MVEALTTGWAGRTVRVGRRAWMYDLLGTWAPEVLVERMMGRRRTGGRVVEREQGFLPGNLLEFGERSWHQV